MRTKLRALALALAATALTATAASAAIELRSYSFTATTSGPITSHSGSFVLAYDNVAHTYSLSSIAFSLGSTVFDVNNTGVRSDGPDSFLIGGRAFGLVGLSSSEDDFILQPGSGLSYKLANVYFNYGGGPVEVTRTDLPSPAAVPEPSAWALMILGFGRAGAALRRRRGLAEA